MTNIFHITDPEEIRLFYSEILPDITTDEALRLKGKLQSVNARDISPFEKKKRYDNYCQLIQELKEGNKTGLLSPWEKMKRGILLTTPAQISTDGQKNQKNSQEKR